MPTTHVPAYRCGTDWSGWLKGAHPTVEDCEVQRTVCFSDRSTGCRDSKSILVKNCRSYFIYKLFPPSSFSHATVVQTECEANILGAVRGLKNHSVGTCV